jgi:hypothetical protein
MLRVSINLIYVAKKGITVRQSAARNYDRSIGKVKEPKRAASVERERERERESEGEREREGGPGREKRPAGLASPITGALTKEGQTVSSNLLQSVWTGQRAEGCGSLSLSLSLSFPYALGVAAEASDFMPRECAQLLLLL